MGKKVLKITKHDLKMGVTTHVHVYGLFQIIMHVSTVWVNMHVSTITFLTCKNVILQKSLIYTTMNIE